jgi:hypothetical protein
MAAWGLFLLDLTSIQHAHRYRGGKTCGAALTLARRSQKFLRG